MPNAPENRSAVQLDIEVLLPGVEGETDPCVARLRETIGARRGVTEVHLTTDDETNRLCVHFDPDQLTLAQVEALARSAGLELVERYRHVNLSVRGISNERRARLIGERLQALEGVLHARASASAARVHVEMEPSLDESAITRVLAELGVSVAAPRQRLQGIEDESGGHGHGHGHGHGGEPHQHGGIFGAKSELIFSLLCGLLTFAGWLIENHISGTSRWVVLGVYWTAYFFGGYYALREMLEAVRAKRLEIDFLMLVAAVGAGALGEWAEGALLLFLFGLGHALEGYAMGRARRAIEALADLAPDTATVLSKDGVEREVAVEALTIGMRVLVRPNTRVPADGFVLKGESSVNQAPITGESMPVDKRPVPDVDVADRDPARVDAHSRVFAGTINGASPLEVRVTKVAADSTLARVVTMVQQAQTQRSPTQRFTDRFERVFVPVVLGVVVLCLFSWLVIDEPFTASFYRAMAVLVAASPCALAIATPSAVLSGVARAARGGVLIKGGAHLEALGAARVVAFDKTGTLTKGEPRLTEVEVAPGVTRAELVEIAVAVERSSDHPLARAVVDALSGELARPAHRPHRVESLTGYGVRAVVDGREFHVGKPDLFSERLGRPFPAAVAESVRRLTDGGRTTVVVASGERFLGVLGLMDPPREEARAALEALHDLGIRHTVMLTGDHQKAANGIAELVGLTDARGDLLPGDKVEAIRELAELGPVAMVGDGVNDAPAMANASVGIAMGAGGSDVALETADVALMADDLTALAFGVGLSRASRRIIRQNLWASLGMVAFLIPATLFGFAGIGLAVLLHEGSTLIVVANALRLLAYRRR